MRNERPEIGIEQSPPKSRVPLYVAAGLLVLLGAGAAGFGYARGSMQLLACQSNLHDLRSALDLYAHKHHDHPPRTLSQTEFRKNIRQIPSCPAAQEDTYSAGYEVRGEAYTLSCQGDNHRHFLPGPETANYPRTSSETGLLVGPP